MRASADADQMAEQVADDVLRSRRYRWLEPGLIRRVAQDEAPKARNEVEAVKRTKRRLHQVFGAYATEVDPTRALASLQQARAAGGAAWPQACADLMGRHASTRERLPILGRFYREIFAITGAPTSVLDLACGLGPLALPWMGLSAETLYAACDVDRRLVEVVEGFLTLAGQPHRVMLRDVVADPPLAPADLAFLLKSAPCLEQQAPGSARRLLERLNARWLVVSYPTRSLGGAGKGMLATYRSQFRVLIEGLADSVHELLFPGELVYVVRRASGDRAWPAEAPRQTPATAVETRV